MRARGLLLATLLSGCALQAPPEREELRKQALPDYALPEAYAAGTTAPGEAADAWLASFGDPQLEKLVAEAIAANLDLRVAAARVEQAAAAARLAGATLWPQVNAMARGGGKLSGDSSGLEGWGIFANWELDLWGRVRYGREAAAKQLESTQLDTEYARHSVAAMVAKGWFLALEARAQKTIATEMAQSSERLGSLARDPKVQALAKDPAIRDLWQKRDLKGLLLDPRVQALAGDAGVREKVANVDWAKVRDAVAKAGAAAPTPR